MTLMTGKAATLRTTLAEATRPLLVAGAHDGLTAVLAEQAGFGAVWASSFEISAAAALPDASLLGMGEYLTATRQMNDAVTVPVIADCDTGFGNNLNVVHAVQQYEAAGVAAVCFEDKHFPKLNSFAGQGQDLVSAEEFASKIEAAKKAQRDPDFMVIARTETLIAGGTVDQALERAHAYADAGADALLIHSKDRTPERVVEFLRRWDRRLPAVVVPTTYFEWSAAAAWEAGAAIVIFANQGLRATVTATRSTLDHIVSNGSSADLEGSIASVKEIFGIQKLDQWLAYE